MESHVDVIITDVHMAFCGDMYIVYKIRFQRETWY